MLHNRRTGRVLLPELLLALLHRHKTFHATSSVALRYKTILLLPTSDIWEGLTKTIENTFPQLDALLIHMDNIPSQLYMFQTGQKVPKIQRSR